MQSKFRKLSFRKIWDTISIKLNTPCNVYFISGMCYSCSVYDGVELPKGFVKKYIEWEIPKLTDTIEEYAYKMAKNIDTKKKFILVGYSFGGVIAQEIARFSNPEKVIIISSMKDEREIPSLFEMGRKMNFADNIPMRLYSTSNFMINLFNRYVYNVPTTALGDFMTVIDPIYIRWSLRQITHWLPSAKVDNIYHIHGTRDQVFPYEQIIEPRTVVGGDHLMIVKRTKDVNKLLEIILHEKVRKQKIA